MYAAGTKTQQEPIAGNLNVRNDRVQLVKMTPRRMATSFRPASPHPIRSAAQSDEFTRFKARHTVGL